MEIFQKIYFIKFYWFFVFKFLKLLSRLFLFLYLNFIHSKFQSKVLLLDYFEFFESDFSFTLSFILKRREKRQISANSTSTSDLAQALILDHFVSTGLVLWSTDYLFHKRSENRRLSAHYILIIDLNRLLVICRFAVKSV